MSSLAAPKLAELSDVVSDSIKTGNKDLSEALGNFAANIAAGGLGAVVGGGSGAATGANADRFNRQLNDSERKWVKENAAAFAKYYEAQTGKSISIEVAQKLLFANGYRIVDDLASKGPGGDLAARSYIAVKSTGGLFDSTAADRANAGKTAAVLTPEQASLPANTANPELGKAAAGALGLVTLGAVAPTMAGAWAIGAMYDYAGDFVGYTTGLSKDTPSVGKSFGVGGVTALFSPLALSAGHLGSGTGSTIASSVYNAGLAGTAAFGAASIFTPGQNPGLAGGIAFTSSTFGSIIGNSMPGPAGPIINQLIQVMSGPTQTAIENNAQNKTRQER